MTCLPANNAFSRLRRALLVCVAVACAAGGWGRTFRWAGATSIDSPGDWNTYNGWEVANSSNDTITGWVSTSNVLAGIGKYHAFPDNDDSNTDTVYIDTSSGDVYLAITKNTEVSKLYVEGSGTVHFIVKAGSTFTIVDTFTIGHNSGYNSSASDDTYNDGAEIKTASSVQIEISGGGTLKANTTAYVNTATDSVISITDRSTFSTGSLNTSSGTIEVTGDGTGTFESTYTPPTVIIAADNLASYPTDSDATIRQSVTTYYWKGETTGGDWQNSDNWAPNPDGTGAVTAGTYPGFVDGDTAVFSAEKVPSDSGFYLINVSVASDEVATLTIRNDSEYRIWITECTHKQETLIVQGYVRMACAEGTTIGSVVVEKNTESASATNTFAVGCALTIAGTLTIGEDTTAWFLNPTRVTGATENNGSIIGIRKDSTGTDQPVTFANLTNNGTITCEAGTLTINGDFVAGASSSFTASSGNTFFYGNADFSAMTAANFVQPATGTIAVITEEKTLTTCAGQTFSTLRAGGTLTIDASNGGMAVTQFETQDATTLKGTVHFISDTTLSFGSDSVLQGTLIIAADKKLTLASDVVINGNIENNGTLDALSQAKTLTVSGTSASTRAELSGNGTVLVGANDFVGDYLSVGSDIKITSDTGGTLTYGAFDFTDSNGSSTSVPTAGITPADYVAVFKHGWKLTEFLFVWEGTVSADWADAENWDIDLVPGNTESNTTGAKVSVPDGKARYPAGIPDAYTLSVLTIGTEANAAHDATLLLADDTSLTVTTTLTNYGTIAYGGAGRIIDTDGTPINDAAHGGTVEYRGTAQTVTAFAETGGYAHLVISGTAHAESNLSVSGDFTVTGTFTADADTAVTFTGAGATVSAPSGSSLAFYTVAIANGAHLTTADSFEVAGDWTNDGAFAASGGVITFSGTTATISGTNTFAEADFTAVDGTVTIMDDNTFGTLSCTGAGTTIRFGAGKTQTVQTAFVSHGADGSPLVLTTDAATPNPDDDTTWWIFNAPLAAVAGTNSTYTTVQYAKSRENLSSAWGSPATIVEGEGGSTVNWFEYVFYWFGKTSSDWSERTNWGLSSVYDADAPSPRAPSSTSRNDDIVIAGDEADSDGNTLTLATDIAVKSIVVSEGKTLDLAGCNVSVVNTFENNGTVRMTGTQSIMGTMTNGADSTIVSTVEYYGNGIPSLPWDGDSAEDGKQYVNLVFADGAAGTETAVLSVSGTTTIANGTGNALSLTGANVFSGGVRVGTDTAAGGMLTLNSAAGFVLSSAASNNTAVCDMLAIQSAVTFAADVTVSAAGGVRAVGTRAVEWRSDGAGITLASNLFVDTEHTLTVASNLSCENLYFYNGTLSAAGITVTTAADFAVWGSAYSPADKRYYISANTRFAFADDKTLSYYPAGNSAATGIVTGTTAQFGTVTGSSFVVGKNLYVNGADMTGLSFVLPSTAEDSRPVFNATAAATKNQWGIPYAVVYNLTATNVSVQCSAAGGHAYITAARDAQYVTDGGGNNPDGERIWQFESPKIASAYSVYDDMIAITFDMPLENTDGQISTAIALATSLATGGVWYNGGNQSLSGGAYANADGTVALAHGIIDAGTPIYVRAAGSTWNTDATATSVGNAQSTNRAGVSQAVTTDLSFMEGLFTAAYGHTMCANYGIGFESDGGTIATVFETTDRCAPVLIAAYTGQELHTAHDGTAESQPYYDAHNFIEFQYSEAVDIGDLLADAGDLNALASATVSAADHGGHITNNANGFTVAGLATFARGSVVAGNKANATESPHALYRTFALATDGAAQAQTHRVRVSVAGYVDGTVSAPVGTSPAKLADYRNWVGYIDAATSPSGTVTPATNAYVLDASGNAIDATGAENHALPAVTVNAFPASVTAPTATSTLYGAWDTTPPSFARYVDGVNDDFQWVGKDDERATYEIIGTVENDVYLQNVEFHLFDNKPAYTADETYKWLARYGWMQGTSVINGGATPDTVGGARDFLPTDTNHTTGGIRRSSLAGAAAAFTYRYHLDGHDSDDRLFNTDESTAPVLQGMRSALFRQEDALTTDTYDDGLYFSLFVHPDDSGHLPIRTRFVITYTPSDCYITDLAGNRLLHTDNGHEKVLNSIDVTPPAFALTLSPVADNKLYVTFTKQLTDERGHSLENGAPYLNELAQEFEFIPRGNSETDTTEAISVTQVELVKTTQDYTILLLTLDQNVTLDNLEQLWLRTKKIDDARHKATNSISGSVEYATLIRDSIGNYMEAHTCHTFSDFALNAVNVLYAYTPNLIDEVTGEPIEKNLYAETEGNDYAVHDFSATAGNYGRLHAGEDITLQVQFVGGKDENGFFAPVNGETMTLIPDLASHIQPAWKSNAYNSFIGANWRLWLTTQFDFMASGYNDAPLASPSAPASVGDNAGLLWNFSLPHETYGFSAGDEVQFIFTICDAMGTALTIDHDADNGVETGEIPLYALWMPNIGANIVPFVDLWSFRLSDTKKQRGGVSILNNVINVSVKEQTVIQVDMPEDGNLNVYVMTLEGNIVQRLEHGRVSAGTHFYRWNGTNRAGNSVARGMYFVRVVGSGIDETRKVLCVKN